VTSIQDKTLTCGDCGQRFTFTAGEQQLYSRKGAGEPRQCAFCRAARKMARGGGASFYGGPGEQRMYAATCTQCGKRTAVPFEPRASRPVYCSDCYQEHRGTRSSDGIHSRAGSDGYDRDRRRSGSYRR
jgi:CxxC-x17-CxxC domain-containing protein